MIDIPCDCGQNCNNTIVIRKGPIWNENNEVVRGWLHVDICDQKGNWLEVMLTPENLDEVILELCEGEYKIKPIRLKKIQKRIRAWLGTQSLM